MSFGRSTLSAALRTPHTAVLGAILVVALALRVPGLGESLWYDEIWSTRVKLGSPALVVSTVAADVHPPFYTMVMFAWIHLFGDSEVSVRLLPLASGLITIVLAAGLAQAYAGRIDGRVAGIATALALALSPVHIWYSQEARHYSLLLALLLACVWSFHRIRETGATRWYVTYAILTVCFVFTHYYALAYTGVLTVLALRDPRMRARMAAIGGAAAALLALFLAVRTRLWGLQTELGSSRTFALADLWRLPFEWFVTSGVFGPAPTRHGAPAAAIVLVQICFLVLVALGVARSGRRSPDDPTTTATSAGRLSRLELALLLLVLPLAFLVLAALGRRGFYIERGALTVLPFFAIAVGVGIAALRPERVRVLAQALVMVFGAIVLANYYAKPDAWTVYKPNPDWRTIGHTLTTERARLRDSVPVIVVSMSPALELTYYASLELRHYSGTIPARSDSAFSRAGRVYVLPRPDPALVRDIMTRERVDALYLAHNRYWLGSDPPGHVLAASKQLIASLEADPSLAVRSAGEAKGIDLFRIGWSGIRDDR